MRLEEYARFDGIGLGELVHKGEVQAQELAQLALAAIERVNPKINAVIALTLEEAERALRDRDATGPLAGVPFLLKDIGAHYAGVPARLGSRYFRGLNYAADSELGARFKRAGLITVGRTNTPELGCNLTTEPVLFGPTRNPWCPEYSPCGSSGGSAAAVAAGIVPFAHANDGGGSIRAPASACGLVGLKPSRGRVPTGPDYDELLWGLGCELVVSRTVRDTAAVLDAAAGPDTGARVMLSAPATSFLDQLRAPPRRMRIAFATAPLGAPAAAPECRAAVEKAAQLLADLGHEVREARPEVSAEEAAGVWLHFAAAFVAKGVTDFQRVTGTLPTPTELEATTWKIFEQGRAMSALEFISGFDAINRISRALGRFFEMHDIWLSPTLSAPPPLLGYLDADDRSISARDFVNRWAVGLGGSLPMFNVSGQPAISIPFGFGPRGLPIGIHLAARLGEEGVLLQLARSIEEASPWSQVIPAIHVSTGGA
jgi:amidase